MLAHVAERREVRGEIVGDELEDPLGLAQTLEPVVAELADVHLHEPRGIRRGQHLAAVGGLADARRAMDIKADEAVVRLFGLAAVEADPHPHPLALRPGATGELALNRERRRGRRNRIAEHAEELVAPGVDLTATCFGDGAALQRTCVGEDIDEAAAEALREPARVLDIAEEEGEHHQPLTGSSARTRVPLARCAFDAERTVERLDPVAQAAEAGALVGVGAAGAVVGHLDHRAPVDAGSANHGGRGARVLDDVRDRLRGHVVGGCLDGLRQTLGQAKVERDRQRRPRGEHIESRVEPSLREHRRMDPLRQLA